MATVAIADIMLILTDGAARDKALAVACAEIRREGAAGVAPAQHRRCTFGGRAIGRRRDGERNIMSPGTRRH